jgi:hypothetical protein
MVKQVGIQIDRVHMGGTYDRTTSIESFIFAKQNQADWRRDGAQFGTYRAKLSLGDRLDDFSVSAIPNSGWREAERFPKSFGPKLCGISGFQKTI